MTQKIFLDRIKDGQYIVRDTRDSMGKVLHFGESGWKALQSAIDMGGSNDGGGGIIHVRDTIVLEKPPIPSRELRTIRGC